LGKFGALITAWALAETVHLFSAKARLAVLQRKLDVARVPTMTPSERLVLFERCMRTVESPQAFVQAWYTPKAGKAPEYSALRRGNVEELIAWAFFHVRTPELLSPKHKDELKGLMARVEGMVGPMPDGYNDGVQMMKFTEEPVSDVHRPLVVYAVVDLVFQCVIVPVVKRAAGYVHVRHGKVDCYVRRGKAAELPPVVFIHGIGVGLLPYQKFLRKLEARCDATEGALSGRTLIAVHLPVIAQRLFPPDLLAVECVAALRELFVAQGFSAGLFIGHSYGTFVVSWLVRQAPELVAALGVIDPVCLLLHSTDVLHNILYHETVDDDACERVLDYIMRREVALEHHLKRDFYWFQSCLFLEDVPTGDVPVFVVLSDNDPLVPSAQVRDYVQRYNAGDYIDVESAKHAEPVATVDLTWLERCDHSGFIFNDGYEADVVAAVERTARRAKRMW